MVVWCGVCSDVVAGGPMLNFLYTTAMRWNQLCLVGLLQGLTFCTVVLGCTYMVWVDRRWAALPCTQRGAWTGARGLGCARVGNIQVE